MDFSFTVSFAGKVMQEIAEEIRQRDDYEFLGKEEFIAAASDAMETARELKQDLNISMLELPEKPPMRQRMGEKLWEKFMESVRSILGASAVDGFAIAEIGSRQIQHCTRSIARYA